MYDDRTFARILQQDREDETKRRRLIREAERARAAERHQGSGYPHAVQAQDHRHPSPTRRAA